LRSFHEISIDVQPIRINGNWNDGSSGSARLEEILVGRKSQQLLTRTSIAKALQQHQLRA